MPKKLQRNLRDAYSAYLDKESDKTAQAILEQCDDTFYKNEEEINRMLQEYAAEMKL